jgi:hypothetical protein
VSDFIGGNASSSEDLVVLKLIVESGVMEVRRAVVFVSIGVFSGLLLRRSNLSGEVHVGENAVVRHHVVSGGSLEVMQVGEGSAVRVTEVHGEVRVSIVNGVTISTMEVFKSVMLDYWRLGHCSGVSTGSVTADAITESKDVLVMVVLHGVLVDVNSSSGVTKFGDIGEDLMGVGGRVDHGGKERLLDNFISIDVSENGNLLSSIGSFNFSHFPAEHDVDVTLSTLLKSNFIGVREFIDVFVRCPVLHASRVRSTTVHHVLSHEMLVVKGVKVGSFALVRSCWGIADKVSCGMEPTSPIVSTVSLLVGKHVDIYPVCLVIFISQLFKSLDSFHGVVHARSHYKCLISEFLAILESDTITVSVDVGDRVHDFKL